MEARPEDVETIDGVIRALYEVLSGPAGPRDWERERTLFAPGARLMPTRPGQDGGPPTIDVFDIDGYIASRSPYFAANDFYEVEVSRRVDRFGNMAHVWSTYESRRVLDEPPFMRGINSIQLVNDGKRWWVVSIFWEAESTRLKLPEKYLKSAP